MVWLSPETHWPRQRGRQRPSPPPPQQTAQWSRWSQAEGLGWRWSSTVVCVKYVNQKEIIYAGPIGYVAISFEMVAMQILYIQTMLKAILLFWKHFQVHKFNSYKLKIEIRQYCMYGTHLPTSMYFCVFSSFLDVITDVLLHWVLASDTKLTVSSTAFTYKACTML